MLKQISLLILCAVAIVLFATPVHACTSAVVSGKVTLDGRPLLWKNRDTKTSIPDPYVTLEVPAGMQIVVDGTFIVNGRRTASGNIMGFTYENAVLNMNADSEVLVNDGGKFYSIGFVTGDGLIRAKSGGMIGETIVLLGYRGGSITTGIYNTIVPFNQYMLNNL